MKNPTELQQDQPVKEGIPSDNSKHVVFLQGAGAGHINPTEPLVRTMTARGIKVTYFACSIETTFGRADPVSDGTPEGELVKNAGATLFNYRMDPDLADEPLLSSSNPMHPGKVFATLPPLVDDIKALHPPVDAIVYDCFLFLPQIVGKILGIPAVGLIPNTGPACTASYENEAMQEVFEDPRKWVQATYGIDIFELGIPFSSWYSPLLNIVLTCSDLYMGCATEAQKRKFGAAPFHCVGSLVDPQTSKRTSIPGFSIDAIAAARNAGKKIILMSLGTAVTGLMWERIMPGDHGFSSGREFAHFVWKAAFAALGDSEEFLVVMAYGQRDDALEGLGDTVPKNFLPFTAVPQLDILPLCSVFITHGGMGSVMESIVFGVPMIVLPVFGDQPDNGANVQRLGIGCNVRYPQKELSTERFGAKVSQLMDPMNDYGTKIKAVAERMKNEGGGVTKAIELILGVTQKS